MIEVKQFEEIVQINMQSEVKGEVPYPASVYLVEGLLIDTGPSHCAGELAQVLEGQYLKLAVNTHYHEDHIGGNAILMRKFGIRIMASQEAGPLIRHVPPLYRIGEEAWGIPEPSEVDCLPERIETGHFHFDVVATPGHCPGHVALVELTKGWCFSGDLYAPRKPTLHRPSEGDIAETVRSMEKLIGLKTDRLILFTSVGRIVEDGRAALRSRIRYYQDLSEKVRRLGKRGLSSSAIRDELFGGESPIAEATGGDISSEHFVRALLSAEI